MAAALRRDLDVEVETVEGRYAEFTVLVDGEALVSGGRLGFIGLLPSVNRVRDLVKSKIAGSTTAPLERRVPGVRDSDGEHDHGR